MSRNVLAGLAWAVAIAAPLAAQEPQQTAPPPPSPQSTAATAAVTIEGCLMREVDVPGRRAPDAVQSRTNTDDDYILIDAKPTGKSTSAAATPTTSPQPDTPVGTSGSVSSSPVMFKVKNIDAAQLVEHKNQRVRIQGTLDRADRTNNPDTFAGDLVLLRGTAIEKIEGTCPSKSNEKH